MKLRVQNIFQGKSNKPEDVFVNTFHFDTAGATNADVNVAFDHVVEFFNVLPGAAPNVKLSDRIGNVVSRNVDACLLKAYNLDDPAPRFPLLTRRWTLLPGASTTAIDLPAELAVCASFYALQNRPRYRGRLYLGPWTVDSLSEGTEDRAKVGDSLRLSIAAALSRLITKGANTSNLAVFSTVDNAMRVATAGWVDDAWDIQRRRGQDATSRTLVPVV